mgnify:CR=1 FL=1
MALSGGMKRRVLIAKALAHEPQILFLDEPTAGVDVELRRDMWEMIRGLRDNGVTIILTTHYIEEAEEMADRIGVINKGEIILVEDKNTLMQKLGKKQLSLQLQHPLTEIPAALGHYQLELSADGNQLIYTFDSQQEADIAGLLRSGWRSQPRYPEPSAAPRCWSPGSRRSTAGGGRRRHCRRRLEGRGSIPLRRDGRRA